MGNFNFESEFVEVDGQVLKVYCESKNKCFNVLIDTYRDPYMIYYDHINAITKDEEEDFRKEIFDYLENQYPEYF